MGRGVGGRSRQSLHRAVVSHGTQVSSRAGTSCPSLEASAWGVMKPPPFLPTLHCPWAPVSPSVGTSVSYRLPLISQQPRVLRGWRSRNCFVTRSELHLDMAPGVTSRKDLRPTLSTLYTSIHTYPLLCCHGGSLGARGVLPITPPVFHPVPYYPPQRAGREVREARREAASCSLSPASGSGALP